MLRLLLKKSGPIIPIVYVDANINQARTANLLRKLKRTRYEFARGIAVVCSIQNCMPVQVDKIFQQISRIKQKHNIPVYSFLQDQCTPCKFEIIVESYYMASVADQVYSLPSTIFQLSRNENKLSWDSFLEQYKLNKFTIKSSQNLIGQRLDKYTSANTLHLGNKKQTHISALVYAQSIQQRLKAHSGNRQRQAELSGMLPKEIPNIVLGK